MSFIKFNIVKNHIFFFLLFASYFLREYIKKFIDDSIKEKDYSFGNSKISTITLFNLYAYMISNLLAIFCVCIIYIRTRKEKKNESRKHSKNEVKLIYNNELYKNIPKFLKRTFSLALFNFMAQIIRFLLYYLVNNDEKFTLNSVLQILSIFYILSTYFLSRFILKSYFYKHHYLSLGINLIALILYGIFELTKIATKHDIISFIINILSTIFYSLASIVAKIVLVEEYLSPYTLQLYRALYQNVMIIIISIPLYLIKRNGFNIFDKFKVIINEPKVIILYIILMILNFIYGLFIWFIIDLFSPNDFGLSMIIQGITDKLFEYFEEKKYKENIITTIFEICINIILILGVCIHNEILIINKYGLNEYTKDKIGLKGEEDVRIAMLNNDDSFNSDLDDLDDKELKKDILIDLEEKEDSNKI